MDMGENFEQAFLHKESNISFNEMSNKIKEVENNNIGKSELAKQPKHRSGKINGEGEKKSFKPSPNVPPFKPNLKAEDNDTTTQNNLSFRSKVACNSKFYKGTMSKSTKSGKSFQSAQNEESKNYTGQSSLCQCIRNQNQRKDKSLFQRIRHLPNELKLEILKRLDVEDLVKLNLPPESIRSIFTLSSETDPKSWFANYVLRQNLGYIYIPQNHQIMINNRTTKTGPSIIQNYNDGNVCLVDIGSALEAGFYKLRMLVAGFDLCKADHTFISHQCGPSKCFTKELEEDWASSYMTRGFELKMDKRKELAPGLWDESSWETPIMENMLETPNKIIFSLGVNKKHLHGPICIIKFSEASLNTETVITPLKCFSIDKLARKNYKCKIQLNVMKSKTNKILAYVISAPSGFCSYDPAGDFQVNEGWNDFCISWYKYSGHKQFAGLVISGRQDGYGFPSALKEIGLPFPDENIYDKVGLKDKC